MSTAEKRLYRFLNAVVKLILLSPLHPLASGSVLLLTFSGRKSGRPYTVPLGYMREERAIVCFTSGEWSTWWKNLRGGVPVTARVQGRKLAGEAEVFTGGDGVACRLHAFLQRFVGTAGRYGVGLNPDGLPEASGSATAVRSGKVIMILVRMDRE